MFNNYYTNYFLNSKYYQEIKDTYNVLFTFIGGSNLLKCNIAESDFDVTIIVSDDFEFSSITTSYMRFKDSIKVHWYIVPINFLFKKQITNKLVALLFFELKYLTKDFLLDLIDEKAFDSIITISHELSTLGCNYILNYSKNMINTIEEATTETDNKWIYYLLYLSYDIFNELPNYTLIKKLKTAIRVHSIPEELLEEAKLQIAALKDYVNTNL